MNVRFPVAAFVLLSAYGTAGSSAGPVAAGAFAVPAAIAVPQDFRIEAIAQVNAAHGLAFLPNGDLLVGSGGSSVALVPQADGDEGRAHTFAKFPDSPAYGVAVADAAVYVATQHALWRMPYQTGDQSAAAPDKIASFRSGPIAPDSDGDVHRSASVAIAGSHVFVGVGSSCNACTEIDPTRATVLRANLDGSAMTAYAKRFRNALALAVNPATGTVWAGGAGQDALPKTHPYEFFDSLTLHEPGVDYGWPDCEEDRRAYTRGADCSHTVAPSIELPAYSTLMGAAFYPVESSGAYAFPARYRGGVFIAAHGSWHKVNGHFIPPRVVFVALSGDSPKTHVDWQAPTAQWSDFVSGFQDGANERAGRPSGIVVGPSGSLFVSDDQNGTVYRIRPK